MIPLYISGCFGVLHPARGKHGVLLCGSLGDEAMNVYRPMTFLAERFAEAGMPALRLEYRGVGDSAGEDGEAGRFQAWIDGIAAGVRWLRENCDVGPVTLVGVRIGAALAARAACEIDGVEALVCLAPLASGRRFLRQMVLAAHTTAEIWQVDPRIDDGHWFEAHGLRIDHATRDALDQLDVGKLPCAPAPRALILDQPDSPAGRTMAEHLQELGTEAISEIAPGLDTMLRDPYENTVPHAAFARAVHWCLHELPQPGRTDRPMQPLAEAVLHTGLGDEMPVHFGPQNSLHGILSMPAHPRDDAPVVMIANTGANPRYSNSRAAVGIARWLAAHGIASLRMDGAGIGDSAIHTGERGQPYSALGDADFSAGVDFLDRRFARPVLAFGMCSGAFHALRTAYDDRRITGIMLVNLQKFVWEEGNSLSVVQRATFRTTLFYMHNVASARVWRRLLRGEINVKGISSALAGRAVRRAAAAADPMLTFLKGGTTKVSRVRACLRELRRRRVQILFVLSGHDPGLDEVAEYFGSQGRQFRRQSNVMFRVLDGADHTFSSHWARESLTGLIAQFLRQRYGLEIGTGEIAVARPSMEEREPILTAAPLAARRPIAIDTRTGAA